MRTLLITIAFSLATLCQADTITVNLTEDTLSGSPGSEVDFTGTLTNDTSETVYINADSYTFAINGALDDSPFLNNAPISVGPDQTSSPFELFDVAIPADETPGTYAGAFTIQGGIGVANQNATDNLGATGFNVYVTPEPVTLPFLAAGLAALFFVQRRRSRVS